MEKNLPIKISKLGVVLLSGLLAINIAFAQTFTVDEIKRKAEQGDAKAQFSLGAMYAKGQGVQQDFAQAKFWYEKAAEQGDVRAQCGLGVMYTTGQGVKKDLAQAKFWLEKAAKAVEQGDPMGQRNLKIPQSR